MVFKQLRSNTLTHTKKTLSTPILFGNPPFSTMIILPVEDPWIYVNHLRFCHSGGKETEVAFTRLAIQIRQFSQFFRLQQLKCLNAPQSHNVRVADEYKYATSSTDVHASEGLLPGTL